MVGVSQHPLFLVSLEVRRRTSDPSYVRNPWQRPLRHKHTESKAPVCLSCHANPGLWIHHIKFTAFFQHFPHDRRHNEAFILSRESETGDVTLPAVAVCLSATVSPSWLLLEGGRKKGWVYILCHRERVRMLTLEKEGEKNGRTVTFWKFKSANRCWDEAGRKSGNRRRKFVIYLCFWRETQRWEQRNGENIDRMRDDDTSSLDVCILFWRRGPQTQVTPLCLLVC